MKPTPFVLAFLVLATVSFAAAAPVETPVAWITPQAQAIRQRVNAAYSAIEGWTASMVTENNSLREGVATTSEFPVTERYLKSGGPVSYYAAAYGAPNDRVVSVKCQDTAVERWVFRNPTRLGGLIAPATELNRPQFWGDFEYAFTHENFVRLAGRETVAGQSCDIVEAIEFARNATDDPKAVTGVTSTRFYVNPAGLIERITSASNDNSGKQAHWADQRITYDANAKLSPADFSRECFERDAAFVLQGKPMPELEEQVFPPGGSLPDLAFIGWADGKPFRISDLKGKIVVLETWASWCHFCKEAFPFYEKTRKALADQDVVFVAVSFDQKLADYEKWMKQHGDGYGFKFARVDSADTMKAMKEFRGSLPAFYVLGRDGKILSSYLGYGYGAGEEDPRLLAALRAAGVKI